MKILELLKVSNVFSIKKKDGEGNFRVREECDKYFFHYLTPEELLELAEEIKELVETSK
jgi:hypothetical protein